MAIAVVPDQATNITTLASYTASRIAAGDCVIVAVTDQAANIAAIASYTAGGIAGGDAISVGVMVPCVTD